MDVENRGLTSVVADHGECGVGVRANDGDGAEAMSGKRERATAVLKKDDALTGGLDGKVPVGGAADVFGAQMGVGLGGEIAVEHSETHLNGESVGQSGIDVGLAQQTSFHCVLRVRCQKFPTVQI